LYLLDTNVVSETRKRRPHDAVVAWLRDTADRDLYVSAVTFGEIQAGIEATRVQDPGKANEIESWLKELASSLQVLPIDAEVFRTWARLMHRRSDLLIEDAMIAATALGHGLTVATRNTKDFVTFGVATFDPFAHRGP
jgi:predicted nucleic acid-binding protein